MRDLIVFGMVGALCLASLKHPWVGIMGWTWVSIMNPHRMTWGFAYTLPVAAALAATTLLGLLISRDKKTFAVSATTFFLVLLAAWMCLATTFAMFPSDSSDMLSRVLKIQVMLLVGIALLHTRKQIEIYIWVFAGSIAFFGIKGGLFTILTGGSYRVWGPAGSFIEGNNEIALALIVVIPLLRYLQLISESKWVRRALMVIMPLSAAAALGSQSRGALLAIVAMGAIFWVRSQAKLGIGIVLLALGAALFAFLPDTWHQRMSTIDDYDVDASAQGRLIAWQTAFNVANNLFFGAGFDMYRPEVWRRYSPEPDRIHAAHSIYFQVLGEHGWVGLTLFLVVWLLAWRDAGRLRKVGASQPDLQWAYHLGSMAQVSMIGYFVGGAFLSLAYFDLPYCVLATLVCARRLAESSLATQHVPAARPGLSAAG